MESESETEQMEKQTAMEGPTGEQPENSLFAQAKRHISETIKYLSCSSRRGRKRAENSEIREDDFNSTETVENWAKTFESFDDTWFSTERFDNWPKILEYFGDSNMIDCLPMEMLGNIASFLPNKDFNSLVRTNKATRSRLRNRDRQPLHSDLTITYEYDDEEKCFCFAIEDLNVSMGTAEDRTEIVADWFYSKEGKAAIEYPGRKTYYSNIKEVVPGLLQFLRHHNVIIDGLSLAKAKEREVIGLAVFLKENTMRVDKLKLNMEVFGDHHFDLIHVCCPTSLTIVNAFVPSIFHDDDVVRKLKKLNVKRKRAFVEMKERDLDVYHSTKWLRMSHIRGATVQDVKRFLNQWINRKVLGYKNLKVACEDAEATGNRILTQLDRQVVVSVGRTVDAHRTRFRLRCIADNRTMTFGWNVGRREPSALYMLCTMD